MQTEEVRRVLREGAAQPSRQVDVGRVLREGRRLKRTRGFGTAALVIAATFGVVTIAANLVGVDRPNQPGGDPVRPARLAEGWTRLSTPPEVRDGASLVWAGSEVLSWGGCDPAVRNECIPTADGYSFDSITRSWTKMTPGPISGANVSSVWTGAETIFLAGNHERLEGQAYDPLHRTWRTIAAAPIGRRTGQLAVWTGSEIVVWGGSSPAGMAASEGAAYDPSKDTWRPIADAPISLTEISGVWTGQEVIVFGARLDDSGNADTETAVGAAYDPAADSWRRLPPSELIPHATSAVWTAGRMVAWSYDVQSQEYDPLRNTWTPSIKMPLQFDECYPVSEVVNDLVFAFFCGRAALYDVDRSIWEEINGGPLDERIRYGGELDRTIPLWRFAELASAGDTVFALTEGITVDESGEACYGCEGSPVSFWAYRPSS